MMLWLNKIMRKKNIIPLLIILGLLVLILPSHVIGIDRFATFDEPWWVISGSNYYYALTHHDFANTIYDYHPAVTTTWVVTAGMLLYFPEYRGFGQGYFDVRKANFDNFMLEHGKHTLDLLRDSRLIQTALIVFLAVISFLLLQKLTNRFAAFLSIVVAMDAPFFLGQSRLLNHEGMLSMFVLVSVLSMIVYLRERKFYCLLISSTAFGLAQLTKSPSIVVLGVVGLMLFAGLFEKESGKTLAAKLMDAIKVMLIWLAVAGIVYVALWPGMWVASGKMLYEVYGNAFSYAFQGARLDVTQELQPSSFSLSLNLTGIMSFVSGIFAHATPVTLSGLLLAFLLLFSKEIKPLIKQTLGYLALVSFLFVLLFGIAKGRDSIHYVLSSFVCLDVIAGLGWWGALVFIESRWPVLRQFWVQGSIAALVIGVQLLSGLPYYPYYYTYENPLAISQLGGLSAYGYGEGLDRAAQYLAAQPDAASSSAFVYAGMGSFSYFYPGQTEIFKKVYLTEPGMPTIIAGMHSANYLVIYSAYQDKSLESQPLYAALKNIQPEHVVLINGVDYARVYRITDIPESVYKLLAQ
jgi:hypothetical protein